VEWSLTNNIELGLRLIVSWVGDWGDRGNIRMIRARLAQLLENYYEQDTLHARALVIYGNILGITGDHTQAQTFAQQGLDMARLISDKHVEAFSLWGLGMAIAMHGNLKQGMPILEQCLALYRSLGDKLGQANALHRLWRNQSEVERSKACLIESLRLYRELGHLWGIAYCLCDLGQLTIWAGDFSLALDCLGEAKTIFRELGNRVGEAYVLINFGTLAYWQGNYKLAITYYEEAMALFDKLGLTMSYWPRVHMAYTFLREGDFTQAREYFELGIHLFQEEGNVIGVIFALEGIACLQLDQGKAERATRLIGWADTMREKIGNPRPPVEQADVDKAITVCLAKMGEAAFSDVYEEGEKMSLEEAVDYAVEET
jgi:tetratricopeptide (TPR) repeat protein